MAAKNHYLSILIIACSASRAQGRVSGASVGDSDALALTSAAQIVHTVNPAPVAKAKFLPLAIRACLPRIYPDAGLFYSEHLCESPARELKSKPAVKP